MNFIKYLPAFIIMPLVLLSCSDKITNNYHDESGMFEATIISHDCVMVKEHKSYRNPDYIIDVENPNNNFIDYLRVSVQLENPSIWRHINRIIIVPYRGNSIELNKQEIETAYQQGRLVFDISVTEIVHSDTKYDITLYNSSSKASNTYPVIANLNTIFEWGWDNEWLSKEVFQITLRTRELIADSSDVETHWLNSGKKEIGVTKSKIVGYQWSASNVPLEALYYYYIINSEITKDYTTDKKRFISGIITMTNRP